MGRRASGGGDSRERLVAAAGRAFRAGGYGGTGVDALAAGAGLTSGAVYAQFGSKANAFRAALEAGLADLAAAIGRFRETHGDRWRDAFVDFYLGELVGCRPEDACTLPTLTPDAGRGDEATRAAYAAGLDAVVAQAAAGFRGPHARRRAWLLLSTLSGAAAIARAVDDPRLRGELLAAAVDAAKAV
jgi:AcrR family transcriptional regulator